MEKVRPWCGQPSDRGRLKNRNRNWLSETELKRRFMLERRINSVEVNGKWREDVIDLMEHACGVTWTRVGLGSRNHYGGPKPRIPNWNVQFKGTYGRHSEAPLIGQWTRTRRTESIACRRDVCRVTL